MRLSKNKMLILIVSAAVFAGIGLKAAGFSEAGILQFWGLLGTIVAIVGFRSAQKQVFMPPPPKASDDSTPK